MAGGGPAQSGGRRRSLDGEMNLVPFIDLLSMCICFLLMTAIWIEVGSIQLHQLLGTEAVMDPKHPLEIQVALRSPNEFQVSVEQDGRVVQMIPIQGANFEEAKSRFSVLIGQLQGALVAQQTQNAPPPSVSARLIPTQSVEYGDLVTLLDILKGYGISALAVMPVREK